MSSTSKQAPDLSKRVYDLVRNYVIYKTDRRSNQPPWSELSKRRVVDPETRKERLDVPQAYREAREKVCMDAFLRLRAARCREDFLAYFTGTICSVPQFLPAEEYGALAATCLDDEKWEDVRSLGMLALSGLSRV